MNKGIVMELSDRHVIVMTSGGAFRKLLRDGRTCEVGEEILFADQPAARKAPPMAKLSGLVAAVVMCIVVVTAMTRMTGNAEVVAYVSMDINPSIEFGISSTEKVLDLKGLNEDGSKLINGIEYKGKKLEAVANEVLIRAEQQGSLAVGEGDIVIASSVVTNTTAINDMEIADKLKEQVTKHIQLQHPNQVNQYGVTAFAAPQEIRQEAAVSGVSMGKYAIYLNAKSNGTPIALEQVKRESVHQLAQQNGGIEALVNPKKPPAKAVFKQLLDDEKSGKLDERVKRFAEQKAKLNGNDDKKPDSKNDWKNNDSSKNDKQQAGKNDNSKNGNNRSNNDDLNNGGSKAGNVKPGSDKPAGGANSSERGSYINNGKSDNGNGGKRDSTANKDGNEDGQKKNDQYKPGDNGNNDTLKKKSGDKVNEEINDKIGAIKDSLNRKSGENGDNQQKEERR